MANSPALRVLGFAAALAFAPSVAAELSVFHPESGRPAIRDFRPTDYRGHPQVYGIVQTADGLIHVGSPGTELEFAL